MYCPRCGTPNEPGDRFCSSCGAGLRDTSKSPSETPTRREWIAGVIGTTRRARAITLGTLLALVIAVVSFIALEPASDDSIPRDAYTIAADRMCVDAKRQIVAAERRSLRHPGRNGPGNLARALVPIVAGWRSEFRALAAPSDRADLAQDLSAGLTEVEVRIAALALAGEDRNRTAARARRVDAASTQVEAAIASLGLGECADRAIGFSRPPG